MTYEEMMKLLRELPHQRHMAQQVDRLKKASDQLDKTVDEFVRDMVLVYHRSSVVASTPALTAVPSKEEEAREMLASDCPFEEANGGLSGVHNFLTDVTEDGYDQLTPNQRQYFKMIRRWYREWKQSKSESA